MPIQENFIIELHRQNQFTRKQVLLQSNAIK